MYKIEKQKSSINKLIGLVKANPELEIIPMVSTDVVSNDSFSYWMGEWGEAELDEYYCSEERIYFKSEDFDELVGEEIDLIDLSFSNISDEEIRKLAIDKVNSFKWIKAIVVSIQEL